MEKAFVLINTDYKSNDDDLVAVLKKIQGVADAYKVCGIYDIVVKIESEMIENVRQIIASKLRNTRHIKSTITMMVVTNNMSNTK